MDFDDLGDLVEGLCPGREDKEGAVASLEKLCAVATGWAAGGSRALATASHAEIAAQATPTRAKRREADVASAAPPPIAGAAPADARWPRRLRRRELPTDEPRRRAEDARRARAVEAAAGFVREAGSALGRSGRRVRSARGYPPARWPGQAAPCHSEEDGFWGKARA
ncbi:unnamed protein product [Prorocentrum cordatum]|uniref:Uncharacterized protein n=1 Tax=Prorocentrum cordatum TaxID=2364126 RepID=A0ABN9RNF7_9DINO|nr:unnamed protein product [Polarella glacialis]